MFIFYDSNALRIITADDTGSIFPGEVRCFLDVKYECDIQMVKLSPLVSACL